MDSSTKRMIAQNEMVSASTIWILFLLFGWSYGSLGKIGLQILYYITLGGLGIWTLVRLFTLNGAIREYNNSVLLKYDLL